MDVLYKTALLQPIGQAWVLQCLASFSEGHTFPFPCLSVKTRIRQAQLTKRELLLTKGEIQ